MGMGDFNETVSEWTKIPPEHEDWFWQNIETLIDSRMTIKEINALSELIFLASQYGKE